MLPDYGLDLFILLWYNISSTRFGHYALLKESHHEASASDRDSNDRDEHHALDRGQDERAKKGLLASASNRLRDHLRIVRSQHDGLGPLLGSCQRPHRSLG
ncbi:MAG: hypothetical protein UT43_C0023G0010 [Parcubacteria group bacterium GW2011_GWC1_39_29]|nr:MAG: hypothetical protein UT43_C0023G0010 [Parcubacteria group bacterium GW2011_GWC1_39_29]